jgi:cobalt-zinc-cadmium efflux system outer membrane protein
MKRLLVTLASLFVVSAVPALAQQPPAAGKGTAGGRLAVATPRAQPADTTQPADFFAPDPVLRQYVLDALERNPSIREAAGRYKAARARVPQATSLADPVFTFGQSIRTPETRVGSQLNTFTLTQAYPWFGKRELRGEVAGQEAAASEQMYLARQRQVIADVKDDFYNLAYVDTAIRISNEERSLLDHYEQMAETRYATGQGLQQAVIKIQAEITNVTNRLQILGQQRETLVARLNTLRDRAPQEPMPPVEVEHAIAPLPLDLSHLYQLGEANRQELQASRALVTREEKAVELAKKDYRPDLMFGVSYNNIIGRDVVPAPPDNGKNALVVSLGVTLPIWRHKYAAEVQQATENLAAEKQGTSALLNEIQFAIRDQVVRVQTLADQIALFDKVLIPQANESLKASESAYETGQLGVLDLLDSERVLLQVRLGNARQRADYQVALANLERAVGTKFPQ